MTSVSFASGPLVTDDADVSRNTGEPVDHITINIVLCCGHVAICENYLSKENFELVLYFFYTFETIAMKSYTRHIF